MKPKLLVGTAPVIIDGIENHEKSKLTSIMKELFISSLWIFSFLWKLFKLASLPWHINKTDSNISTVNMHDKSPIYQPLLEHFWSEVTCYFDEGSEAIFCNIFTFEWRLLISHLFKIPLYIYLKFQALWSVLVPASGDRIYHLLHTFCLKGNHDPCKNCSNICTTSNSKIRSV